MFRYVFSFHSRRKIKDEKGKKSWRSAENATVTVSQNI
jgi:hypothetical protein